MHNKLKLSGLEGYVLIDGDIVSVMNDEGESIQVSADEWETLCLSLRFDDAVNYENGETPMTVYQLRSFIEMSHQVKNLEAEKERLKAEIT